MLLKLFLWIFHYSGAKYIYHKFNPSSESGNLPTGFLWALSIYIAFFGVASQRYENRIDIIENRANAIFSQLGVPSVQKNALSRIARVQTMWCPKKPDVIWPHTPFISLFSDQHYMYDEMVAQLKETLEDWKGSLDYINLKNAYLKDADLSGANLQHAVLVGADLTGANMSRADLSNADLSAAIGLTVAQLCEAKKLYWTLLDSQLYEQARENCPDRMKL